MALTRVSAPLDFARSVSSLGTWGQYRGSQLVSVFRCING